MIESYSGLGLLFSSAFIAATILPAQSELVLVTLNKLGQYPEWQLLIVASIGNILGAVVNWLLGRYIGKSWFSPNDKWMQKATTIYQKYGIWTLLLSWMPFIGDPLTLVAGIFRVNIWLFLPLVAIGKTGRYALLLYAI